MLRTAAAFWILCSFALLPVSVEAQSAKDKTLAKKHFAQAELHYQQGEFRKALLEYKTAHRHVRHPAFIFNIAQCHRQLGEYKKALFFYRLFLSEQPNAANKAEVNLRIHEMEKKLAELRKSEQMKGRLSIITKPNGASIRVDKLTGPPLGQSPTILTLPAGQHMVMLEKQGFNKIFKAVTIKAGQLVVVEITLEKSAGATMEPHPATVPSPIKPRVVPVVRPVGPKVGPKIAISRPAERKPVPVTLKTYTPEPRRPIYKTWWFWTGYGATALFLAGGIAAGTLALKRDSDWRDSYQESDRKAAKRNALIADISLGLAAAAAITTTVTAIVLWKKGKKKEKETTTLVAPSCGPAGCHLSVLGRF